MSTLQVIWFFLIGILLIGYSILDGFDLGVGFLSVFAKKDEEKRLLLNSIGPVWDGNEVWLLTGGGAIFAAFPHVYATVFSGFYLALMLVLFSLIFRAVAVEYRSKETSEKWRARWDLAFFLGSALPALLFGVALGNILRGIPLDKDMNFTGNFFTLLNPYSLLIGVTGLAMLVTHGALYLKLKLEGDLAERARTWASTSWLAYVLLIIAAYAVTIITQPHLLENYKSIFPLWILPILALIFIVLIKVNLDNPGKAFFFSAGAILLNWATIGAGLFPRLVPALGNPDLSLTAYNASSSARTLTVMLVLAIIGMPIVVFYTIWVYKTFSGRVRLEKEGY